MKREDGRPSDRRSSSPVRLHRARTVVDIFSQLKPGDRFCPALPATNVSLPPLGSAPGAEVSEAAVRPHAGTRT